MNVNDHKGGFAKILNLNDAKIAKHNIQVFEETYPETIKKLFDTAFYLIDGGFGEKLKKSITSEAHRSITFNGILVLVLAYIKKSSLKELSLPELFHQLNGNKAFENSLNTLKYIDLDMLDEWLSSSGIQNESIKPIAQLIPFLEQLQFSSSDKQIFIKFFLDFIDHLVNPSHVLVDLLIHKNHLIERAIDTTLMIKNPMDKSKSIELLIYDLLDKNQIDRAIELWELIPVKQEKFKAAIKITEKMIEAGKIDEALKFSDETMEPEPHDHLLREASLKIAKRHLLPKALEVIESIKDAHIKYYAQSNLVHLLCNQFDFFNAKKVALAIEEEDFKEDAIMEIVKNYLTRRKYDEAIQFINSLDTPYEKRKPAKLIEIALKIRHEDEKVSQVRTIFSIMKAPIRKAA